MVIHRTIIEEEYGIKNQILNKSIISNPITIYRTKKSHDDPIK